MTRSKQMLRAFSAALWDTDLISSRLTLAFAEFCWTVMLFWQGDTFNRPTYSHMASVMNEEMWGLVFFVSCVTQITVVLLEDMHSTFARYFAGWNACLWVYTVYSMLASIYPPPAAVGGEIALAVSACWIWARPYILAKGYRHAYRTS